MKNSRIDNKSRDREDFRGRDSRRSMHSAVCDECGKDCQVPFKPTTGKPLYCNECFEKKGGRSNNRSTRRDSYRRGFRGRESGRFNDNKISNRSVDLLLEKVETLDNKLNTVIDLLSVDGNKISKSQKSKKKKNKKTESTKVDKQSKQIF